MADYKDGIIKAHQRSCRVEIKNPYLGVPTIIFDEEIPVRDGDKPVYTIPLGQLTASMDNPIVQSFSLRNPITDEIIGTTDATNGYVWLYSLYRALADERDNYVPPPPPEPLIPP